MGFFGFFFTKLGALPQKFKGGNLGGVLNEFLL